MNEKKRYHLIHVLLSIAFSLALSAVVHFYNGPKGEVINEHISHSAFVGIVFFLLLCSALYGGYHFLRYHLYSYLISKNYE